MTRLFDASPARVFEAMTNPEHVKRWWGRLGEGYSVPVCEIAAEGDKTRLTSTAEYPTREVRDMVIASGMEKGAALSYDQLEKVAAELLRA
jgi:uncharacterized protein YndB with AHSA1/START domain